MPSSRGIPRRPRQFSPSEMGLRVEALPWRPDPMGTSLQLVSSRHYPEYALDRRVSDYRIGDGLTWTRAENGARFWVQSLNEFTLTNGAQLKLMTPMGSSSRLGLRLDRHDDRDVHHDLLRVEFRFDAVAGGPLFLAVRIFPRWEKEDVDAEFVLGTEIEGWGEARLRLFAFDLFINAAYALAESRDAVLTTHIWQEDWPLGVALEWVGAPSARLRTEAYLGLVLEASTRYRTPKDASRDHGRTTDGWLGGGMLEWSGPWSGLRVGGSIVHGSTHDRAVSVDGLTDESIEESLTQARLYTLFSPTASLDVELSTWFRRAEGTHQLRGASIFQPEGVGLVLPATDTGWIHTLLLDWMAGDRVGLEAGLIRVERSQPRLTSEETADHRLLTRCLLQPTPSLWIRFGLGWDLDGGDGRYDGGGMTLVSFF